MSRYGKHPRLSLEQEGVNFQDPPETDEFPLVATAEKEEKEGKVEVKEEEEEEDNKQKNEEDNKKKEEEEKGKEDGKEECCDEVDEEENETGEEGDETGEEENETEEEGDETGEEENETEEEGDETGEEENETGEDEIETGEEGDETGEEGDETGEDEIENGEEGDETGEEDVDISSIFFSSSNVSLPSFTPPSPSSSSSSSSSFFSLIQSNIGLHEGYAPGMLSIFQNAQSFFPSSVLGGNLDEATSYQEDSFGAIQSPEDPETLLNIVIQEKATDLVFLFIYKYRMKEPITLSEIYEVVTKDYENHFPVIFIEASKCLEMTFGIDIKESELLSSAYVFVNSLNLTYEDMLSDNDRLPRNAFLIVILGVIFIEGNCASEERIWEFLKLVGVHDGEEHFICGDPREFLTIDLVQQNYLEYRLVSNSQPPCFEFLWGPRAYAETTKMKVLEFLAKMNGCDPTDFSVWYDEALREEEERAWAIHDSAEGSPDSWLLER
ncbi:4933402E13Rik [Phodopus roborovskii]|uniref:4933402E13Rik protein n=1 Tax=Phodopus roborovskii TaxID=109678 RepID=A0AAU9YZR5_PHORO|nr:4933402E13Rik [Phodopus roborovskii]